MAAGAYFGNEDDPKVMIRVGKPGDRGSMEISNMLFTVRGNTAGCILMEWNIHESTQGSASMWDSHFRVGGNAGSDLLIDDCPARSGHVDRSCMSAAMLLHLTPQSSAYFDNVWVWVADHDLDDPANAEAYVGEGGIPMNGVVEISVYAARGVLIESQGPTWMWGCGSEHAQLYQWQIDGAKNIVMGHMQTETPYYQSDPDALTPYKPGTWINDPEFEGCGDDSLCLKAWALRVINSTDIFLYGLGFYSFFDDFELGCAPNERCQQRLIETTGSGRTWLFNIFTKGNAEIVSPQGNLEPLWFNSTTRNGYTSNVAAWMPLALRTGKGPGDGGTGGGGDDEGGEFFEPAVYIDPIIWSSTSDTATIQCTDPCTYVLPPKMLDSPTTIGLPRVGTTLEVGWFETQTYTDNGVTSTTRVYVTTKTTTTITFPAITVTRIDFWNVVVTGSSTTITPTTSISVPAITLTETERPNVSGTASIPLATRTITPPPWPWPADEIEDDEWKKNQGGHGDDDDDNGGNEDDFTAPLIIHTRGDPKPTCRSSCGTRCKVLFCDLPCLISCPPSDQRDVWGENLPGPGNPNQPEGPEGSEEECETSTFEECREHCIAATPTPDCTTTCSNIVGCDATGTDIAATVTPAPAYGREWAIYPEATEDSRQELWEAAKEVLRILKGLGLYNDISPPTTTTDRSPTPPTSTSPPPQPPLPESHRSRSVVFALQELFTPSQNGLSRWDREWKVYSNPRDQRFDLCEDRHVYDEETTTPSAMEPYPPSMSFNAVEGLRCSYEGSSGSLGRLSCEGISGIECVSESFLFECFFGNPTIRARVRCFWG